MKTLQVFFVALVLGLPAIFAQRVVTAPVRGWPAIRVGTTIDAHWIRGRFPFRLVSPDWIRATGQEEFLRRWLRAESFVRTALVIVVWLACVLYVIDLAGRRDTSDKTLERTGA